MNLRDRKMAKMTSTMSVFQEGEMNLRERKKTKMTSTKPVFQRDPDKARMYERELSKKSWEELMERDPDKARMYERELSKKSWEEARKLNVTTIRDLGYVFAPSEQLLIKYYLERKYLGKPLVYCPIEVVDDLYSCHPQDLSDIAEKSGIWYFFTTSRPNEIQPKGKVQGEWTSGGMNIVFNQNQKVGAKQVYEYCEGVHRGKYKMIEYLLDPAPINIMDRPWFEYCEQEGIYKRIKYDDSAPHDVKCPWFLCQLCKDDGSGRDV